ncbi:MAG: glycine--tRNA ligase subunit beta, partial [Synergistota bacterium]|nr:glycine--tRNA ligase subunit beta [Synergistota bacterium]
MKTRDLLLEVGTEEIPAGFVRWALDEIVRIAEKDFKRERLSFQKIQSFGTPRRITLVVRGLGENQDDLAEEFKGPLWEQAFDVNDNPTKAAKGFARSRQVEVDELEKREVGGKEYAFAVLRRPGSPATDVLPELLQGILKQIVFPKNMYWDQSFTRFARPVRWILCLFGTEKVPVSFGRVASSNSTRGHRFMGDRVIEIFDVDEYQDKLFDNYVLFDPDKRREKMMAAISSLEKEVGGKAENDADLIEENLFLVEYPVPFAGSF